MADFPFFFQRDSADCGPASLAMVARFYGKDYSIKELRAKSYIQHEGVSMLGLSDAAEAIGFKTNGVRIDWDQLKDEVSLPCIAYWQKNHFTVVYKIEPVSGWRRKLSRSGNSYWVHVADPARGIIRYSESEFNRGWQTDPEKRKGLGYCLLLEPTKEFYEMEGEKTTSGGFSYFYSYLIPFKKLIIQFLAVFLISTIIQLAFPFLTQAIVDKGINFNDISFLKLVLFAQLALIIGEAASEFIRGLIALHLSARINLSLISHFLIVLMKLPASFFDSKKVGDIVQRINDNKRIELFLTSVALPTLFSAASLVVLGVVLAFYSLKILLIFFIGSLFYIFWVRFFLRQRRQIDNRRFSEMTSNQNLIMELIEGIHEIKLNNSERKKRWQWEKIQAKLFKISLSGLKIDQYQQAGGMLINNAKNFTITFFAAQSVIEGSLSLGMMLAIQYIIGQLNVPINQFLIFIRSWQDARLSIDRLNEIQEKDTEGSGIVHETSTLFLNKEITIRNLSYQYYGPNSPVVLSHLNTSIPSNKVTAIVGASGSGKTTLLKLLLGFYSPTHGEILIGDSNLKSVDPHFWRQHVGAVLQDGFIFSDSIEQNIALSGEEIDHERIQSATDIANIKEFIETLPLGLATIIGAEGIGISQGQRQRILIARGIYKAPQFILLDEATNSLDANNELAIVEKLATFFNGRTVIVVAHRLSTVKNADKIIVLDRGRIVEEGTHDKLVERRGYYFNLVKNQLELGA